MIIFFVIGNSIRWSQIKIRDDDGDDLEDDDGDNYDADNDDDCD